MQLKALSLSAARTDSLASSPRWAKDGWGNLVRCAFCGVRSGPWQIVYAAVEVAASRGSIAVCPLCALALDLQRPRIDQEAMLIWLPEASQQALNFLIREIHIQLLAAGECLHDFSGMRRDSKSLHRLYHARAVLGARAEATRVRLGTDAPSELGDALQALSPAARARQDSLLGGTRLLPLGRFYSGGQDVYPEMVGTWLAAARRREGTAP